MKVKANILSAELSGFQAYVESLPPDGIASIMNEISSIIESTIRLHQGKINRFTGDAFLAVFYTSKSNRLACKQALDAAFELKDLLNSFVQTKELDQNFGLKIGIAYGNIITTELGSKENKQETIMGETVNHAHRICQFAKEGQILMDLPSHEGLKGSYEFQSLEPIPLNGGMESMEIFEALKKKRKKIELKRNAERKIISEMIGRDREMEQIEGLIQKLINGKGSVVNIVGKAGIGKSRLVEELKVQTIMQKVYLLEGHALSTGQNLSFHPITNLIKSWAEITEDDLPLVASEKLFQGIKQNTPEQADEIYAFIATMMGLPLQGKYKERVQGIEGEALEKLILKNLRDLIISATKDKPRIYLVEDMHWADSSSLTMFESLYKLSQNHPVMFINVLRPGYKETGDYILKWLVDNLPGDNITINVSPLADGESGELINNLLKKVSLPEKVANTIIRKTEGNPFFIEEVIRSFLDEGIIEIKEKEFIVTERINKVNIPETINDVILSRVDKLDEKTRDLLNTASVIGRNFYYKVLEEATDTIEELDDRLAYLTEVQLISESKKKEEIEYLFKHALAQQLTYDSIIQQSRKELHNKIARSIEKVFAENIHEFYGTLAHHYEKAENKAKTEEYFIKAGDEAMKSAASTAAIHYYEKVLVAIKSDLKAHNNKQKIIDIEEKLSYAFHAQGENRNAANLFTKVLLSFNLPNLPKNRIVAIYKVVYSLICLKIKIKSWSGKQGKETNPLANKLLKIILFQAETIATYSPKESFFRLLILINHFPIREIVASGYGHMCLMGLSSIFPWIGRLIGYGRMVNTFTWKIIDIENTFNWIYAKRATIMIDYLVNQLPEDNESQKVFDMGMKSGQYWALTLYHAFQGISYVELGNKIKAGQILNNMFQITSEFENSFSRIQNNRMEQTSLLKFRQLDDVIKNTNEIINYIKKTDHDVMLLLIHCFASMAYCFKGDIEKAKKHQQEAEELSKQFWIKYYVSTTLLAKAYIEIKELELNLNQNHKEKTKNLIMTSKLLADSSKKVNCNKTEAYRIRAIAYVYAHKPKKAFRFFKKSVEFAKWYGAKLELSRTYFETGKFLSDPSVKYKELNGKSGSYYLNKAKTMFEEMDLQWDLKEYGKFMTNP